MTAVMPLPPRSSCGPRCGRSPRCRRGPGPPTAPSAARSVMAARNRRLRGGVGAGQRPDDEGPLARPGAHQALALQVAVGLEHRVRVDRQLGDDLLGGRQPVARLQQAEPQGLVDLLDQLQVGGDARGGVELELDHHPPSTNRLVKEGIVVAARRKPGQAEVPATCGSRGLFYSSAERVRLTASSGRSAGRRR